LDSERADVYQLYAGFCRALADANRLLIITELAKGELSVSVLTEKLGLQQANVSKHLGMLREHGLVTSRREGTNIYYALSDMRIYEAISLLREAQSDQLDRRHKLAQNKDGLLPEAQKQYNNDSELLW
jgi:ArsR family transcriptional regulator, virulence genes transcriptional regulator